MANLLARAEITKLAAQLGVESDELAGFEQFGSADLRALREAIDARWLDRYRGGLETMAVGAKFLPAALAAKIAEHAFGPFLAAQVAGLLPPRKAAEIAAKTPPSFLADIPRYVNPVKVSPILAHVPQDVLRAAIKEVLARKDYIGIATFADHVSPDLIRVVVAAMDSDQQLLGTGQFIESAETVNRVLAALPDEKLRSAVHTTLTGTTELRLQGVALLARLDEANKVRVAPELLGADAGTLTSFADTVLAEGAVDELLSAVITLPAKTMAHVVNALPADSFDRLAGAATDETASKSLRSARKP
jgi:hypothetical protein